MTKSFDEWINENGFNFRPEQYDLYKYLYEAGQQSKQAEVDELRKRIDEALRFYNEAKSPHNIGMIQMAILLKGNKDEN